MDDYITVLLNHLEDHAVDFLPGRYYIALNRQAAAAQALRAQLTERQQALFLTYEDRRNDTACLYQEALARQAFLLGREVFR